MRTSEAILVLSVQHTGTWFAIDLLKEHPDVDFFSEYPHLVMKHPALEKSYQECQESLELLKGAGYDPLVLANLVHTTMEVLPEEGRVLLHQHTQSPKRRIPSWCQGNVCMVAFHDSDLFRIVTPIRDPLLALISRHERIPEQHNSNLVDDFECVIELLGSKAFFLPVDLPLDFDQRLSLLKRLLCFVGLPFHPCVESTARDWTPKNTRGDYELKRWYSEGSLEKIVKVIPQEVRFLQSREVLLRPFLERLGYRNLLWWS